VTGPLPISPAPAAHNAAGVATDGEQAKVREAAKRLEGVFMSILVQEMFKGSGLDDASPVYQGLVTEKLGDSLAEAGGIGLAAMIERQLAGEEQSLRPSVGSEKEITS